MKKLILICLLMLNLFIYAYSQEFYSGLAIITLDEIGNGSYSILSEDEETGIVIIEYNGGTYVLIK